MGPPQPTVSIVIPNHNHAAYLRQSLAAILGQTRPADEVVVVDDGSTDDSLEVIAGFAATHPSLRLVRHAERQGVVAAVNRGIREARGGFVILASADERVMASYVERMLAAATVYPEAKVYVARFTEWRPETGELSHGEDGDCDLWFIDGAEPVFVAPGDFIALLGRAHVRLSVNAAMFRRAAMLDVGLLDPALRWHSDWFMIYATAMRHGFVAVPEVLSWFRVAPGSYSSPDASSPAERRAVASHLLEKLDRPEFADVRGGLMRAPAAMAPFLRDVMTALACQPARWGQLARVGTWFAAEVARGRRPQRWARLIGRRRPPVSAARDARPPSSDRPLTDERGRQA